MNNTQRKEITKRLIEKLYAAHEALLEVSSVGQEIAADSPALSLLILVSLIEAQEPLKMLKDAAEKAVNMEFSDEAEPVTIQ